MGRTRDRLLRQQEIVKGDVMTPTQKLNATIAAWKDCTDCAIGTRAKNHVFWRGFPPPVPLVFIGEGPGRREDEQGIPFVGRAGVLLNEMLDDAGLLTHNHPLAITNLVCCRPCDKPNGPNRAPTTEETRNCAPRLQTMLNIFRPRTVTLLGKTASFTWNENPPINNVVIFHLYHPAYTLRSGGKGSTAYNETVRLLTLLRKGVFGK
jgi:DNA polymerase